MRFFWSLLLLLTLPSFFMAMDRARLSPAERSFMELERYTGPVEKHHSLTNRSFVINVSSQPELKNLNSNIRKAIKSGEKEIEIRLAPKVFFYDKLPVYLYNMDAGDVSIRIIGDNTVMVAGGTDYLCGNKIKDPDRSKIYLNQDLTLRDIFGDMMQAGSPVEIVNLETKECRILCNTSLRYVSGLKIQLSEWYFSPIYEVSDIRDRYIYFIADDLKYDVVKHCYNVNYDYGMGKNYPRYRLVDNRLILNNPTPLHECEVSQFLILYNLKLKYFSISGIEFKGCAQGKDAMLYFRDVDAEGLRINDCKFESINYKIVKLKNAANFVFCNNYISNCYEGAVYSYVDCPGTIVRNNYFYRAEKAWTNSSCVACYGEDFLVADNTFEDIGYSSIVSGFNYAWGEKMVGCGIIERNNIFFGEEYYNNPWKYTLYDSGAIYIGTQNKKVIVRYNNIHNYRAIRSNRAIYCDAGAMNVKIYGNVISGVTNAHSILSWRDLDMHSKLLLSNDGIELFYNVIWGNYKCVERPNSSCIHGKNLILYADGEAVPNIEVTNFAYSENDEKVSGVKLVDGRMILPSKALRLVRQFPTYDKMKKWLE